MSFTKSWMRLGKSHAQDCSWVARAASLLATVAIAFAFLTVAPIANTEVNAATASKSQKAKSYKASKRKYYRKRKRAKKRKYYKKRRYTKKRKYAKKRKYYKKRKYSKKRKSYKKRRYASKKRKSYKKRKYASKKRRYKKYAKGTKRPKIGLRKRRKSKRVRVAALGKSAYPSASKKSLSGGGVRWVASSKCLNGRLKALMYKVAANYGSVTVSSTCRSRSRNARVGGAKRSQHLTGSAVDFRVHGKWGAAWAYIKRAGGVGGYKHYGGGLFHVDTGQRRTW